MDVVDPRRPEEILRLLDEASLVLGSSLDYQATLKNLAQLAVPRLADICVIDVLEDARIRRLEVAHADPAVNDALRELARRHPPRLVNACHPLERAIATGTPQLVSVVDDSFLALIEQDEERLAILRELRISSAMVVPLVARGRPLGAITLARTATSRRYDAEDLTFAAELARRAALAMENAALYEAALLANKSKTDFLAMMSHELRTPLNAILGYADLLASGVGGAPLEGRQLEYLSRLGAGAWHIVGIIEGILSHSRLEAGREKVRRDALELGTVVRESVAMVEQALVEKGLALALELPPAPVPMRSDGAKLKQVLLNLLSNAVKFTVVGEICVRAREADGWVTIEVCDTGIGIRPEHVERVFDPFWQVDQPTSDRVGTGLGLSVTRRLARLLGGDVTLESSLALGSTFTVRVLAAVPDEGANAG